MDYELARNKLVTAIIEYIFLSSIMNIVYILKY